MDTIYLLAIEVFLGIVILNFFPEPYGVFVFVFLVMAVGVTLRKKIFFYWIIPAVFLISFLMRMDRKIYTKGDFLSKVEVEIYDGRGKILKIKDKFPQKRSVVILDRVKNGDYEVEGRIERIYERENEIRYYLKPEKIKKLEKWSLKEKFQRRNEKLSKDSRNEEKNLFFAVVSGEKEALSPKIKKLFIENGVSHLLAISGMHLGILLFLMEFLLKKTKLYKREKNLFMLFTITLYFISVRESASLERAYIMAVIYLMGNILSENSDNIKSLALAFIIGIILKPSIYKELSFVLSYWAMMIIFVFVLVQKYFIKTFEKKLEKRKYFFNKGILMVGNYIFFTIFLQLGIAPLIYYNLGTFSLKAIFMSLIITPLGSVYIILCFISLIFPIMPLTNIWYNLLIKSMEFFG
ncbi:MAG: ComEC/Rec2 family competence protein [Fusobacteriaceae bacterium]